MCWSYSAHCENIECALLSVNHVETSNGEEILQAGAMPVRKKVRFLVLLLMTAFFLISVVKSISEWRKKKVGETQSTKSTSKIFFPSLTMFPIFERNFSLAKLSSFNIEKNLTEYNLKTSHIHSDIISINQKFLHSNKYDCSFSLVISSELEAFLYHSGLLIFTSTNHLILCIQAYSECTSTQIGYCI